MGRDPAEKATPDLFSTDTNRDAVSPPLKSSAAEAVTLDVSAQRHILPKNLRHAIKQLNDGELDELFEVAFDEAKRRGRLPWSVGTDLTSSSRHPSKSVTIQSPGNKSVRQRKVEIAEVPLSRGQVNAVRAVFKAGVTVSRIARQFGISQADVRKALASDTSK
jgi:hypothetical protein